METRRIGSLYIPRVFTRYYNVNNKVLPKNVASAICLGGVVGGKLTVKDAQQLVGNSLFPHA